MADNKNLDEVLQKETFDESLRRDAINSALGKDNANIPSQTLKAPEFSEMLIPTFDNVTKKTLDINDQDNLTLNDQEKVAEQQGSQDFINGKFHSSEEDIAAYNRGEFNILNQQEAGGANVTKELAADYVAEEEKDLASGKLYKQLLGDTAYGDLKRACGLAINDSFSDYYYKTKFIPKGYEVDAKLALAEERRMKLYESYGKGEISYNKFLYEAYGKDLLKEQGYDFSSPIFWYNRYKNNNFTNPMDSVTFLSDLITNADSIFKSDSWYRDLANKKLGSALSGISTGTQLTEDEFKKLFSAQVEALSKYFDEDVKKIMHYYQAGYLSSGFSPFIDINGDGKFDYYYHTDGKLYAVDNPDSVGKGNSTVTLEYNDDGSVHSAQVHEGLDGWADSLWDGFSNFFIGLADIGALAVNGVSAIFGCSFSDQQTKWEAWKKRTISDEDRVIFDGMDSWNGSDWGNKIAEGAGYIVGMVALILLTYGIGAIASSGQAAATGGTELTGEALKEVIGTSSGEAVKNMTAQQVEKVVATIANKSTSKAIENAAYRELAKQIGRKAISDVASISTKEVLGGATRAGINATISKIAGSIAGNSGVLTSISKARGGTFLSSALQLTAKEGTTWAAITGNTWFKAGVNATELAIRDYLQVTTQLQAQNRALAYMSENAVDENGNKIYHALTDQEIFGRAARVAVSDMIISTLFRAQGDQGFSSRFVFDTSKDLAGASKATLDKLKSYMLHMKTWAVVDSCFDIFENISTAVIQAVESNPYAQTAEQKWATAKQTVLNPTTIMMNIYATVNNLHSWGKLSNNNVLSTSIMDDRMAALIKQTKSISKGLGDSIESFDLALAKSGSNYSDDIHVMLTGVRTAIQEAYANTKLNGTIIDADMASISKADELFTLDTLSDKKVEGAFKEAFNLSDQEYDNAVTFVKQYNTENPNNQIGLVSGIMHVRASQDNNDIVVEIYKEILNKASIYAKQREENTKGIFYGLRKKITGNQGVYGKYISKLLQDVYIRSVKDSLGKNVFSKDFNLNWVKTYVDSRFNTIHPIYESGDADEYNLEKTKFEQALNNKYMEMGVFTEDSIAAGITYTFTKNEKGNYDVTGVAPKDGNIIVKLLADYTNNKSAVDALIKAGYLKISDDGQTIDMSQGVANWFYITIDSSKRNDLIHALNTPDSTEYKELKPFYDLLDVMAVLSEEGLTDSYKLPLIIRTEVTTGTSDNPNAKQTVYIIGNAPGSGLTEQVNRLQAFEAQLYTLYTLATYAENPDGHLSNEAIMKMTAQLGALLTEEAVQDPYYSFLEEWDKAKKAGTTIEDFKGQLKLATTYMLKAASMTDDTVLFNRAHLLNLYKCGALDTNVLKELLPQLDKRSHDTAELLIKYIEYSMEENNKVKTALKNLTDYQKDKTKSDARDAIISFIKDMNEPENKDLYDILKKDNKIPKGLQEIIDSKATNPEVFANFWRELQSITHFGALENLVSGYDTSELEEFRDQILDLFFNEDITRELVDNVNNKTPDHESLSSLISETLIDLFGLDPNDKEANFFKRYAQKPQKLRAFLENPEEFAETYLKTFKDRKGFGPSESHKESVENIIQIFKAEYSDNGHFDYNKLFTGLKNTLDKTRSNLESSLQLNILLSMVLGKEIDSKDITLDNGVWKYKDGSNIAEEFFNSKLTKKLLLESITPDIKDISKQIIETSLSYYYNDTEVRKADRTITINLLDFLPKSLAEAIRLLNTSKQLATTSAVSAKIQTKELKDSFATMFQGTSSKVLTSQYNNYREFLSYAMETGNYILNYSLDNASDMYQFRRFMTMCGYDNDIEDIEDGILTIDGITFKSSDTHNISASIQYDALRNKLLSKSISNIIRTSQDRKNYSPIITNLFNSLAFVNEDDNVVLMTRELKTEKDSSIIDQQKSKYKVNETLKEVPVYNIQTGYIYTPNGKFCLSEIASLFSRKDKGTLEGGQNINYYIVNNRSIDYDDATVDIKSKNTSRVIDMINSVCDYLTTFTGNNVLTLNTEVRIEDIPAFEAMYSDPNSIWTFKKLSSDANYAHYQMIYDVNSDKASASNRANLINAMVKKGFNLKMLIPIWTMKVSEYNSVGPEALDHITNETLYSKLVTAGIEELSNSSDFKRELTRKYKGGFYEVNYDEFVEFQKNNNNKTYKEIIEAANNYKNNYYIQLLKYNLQKELDISTFAKSQLNPEDAILVEFKNEDIRFKTGTLLNSEYSDVLVDPKETRIEALAKEVGISKEAMTRLITVLISLPENTYSKILGDIILPKQDIMQTAFSEFICRNEDGTISISMEHFAQANPKVRQDFINALIELKTDPNFNSKEIDDFINKLVVKQTAIDSLQPTIDKQTPLEYLLEYSGLASPNIEILLDKGIISNSQMLDKNTLNAILDVGIARKLKRNHGNAWIKASTLRQTPIDAYSDAVVEAFNKLLDATSLHGINNNRGSTMVENMSRQDMVGKYFVSTLANTLDIAEALKAQGFTITKEMKPMIADIAIKMHAYSTGATYQSEFASTLIIEYDSSTNEYKITPLQLTGSDEDRALFSYFMGREAFTTDDQRVVYSLDNMEKILSDPNKHIFLYKGAKDMFVDNIDGRNTNSTFVELTTKDKSIKDSSNNDILLKATLPQFKDKIIYKSLDGLSDLEKYDVIKTNFAQHLETFYGYKYRLSSEQIWHHLENQFENIGVIAPVLQSIFGGVKAISSARRTSLGGNIIDDVIAESIDKQGSIDDYHIHLLMDTLKYGVNSSILTSEDNVNFDNASNVLTSKAIESFGPNGEQIVQKLDNIVQALIEDNGVNELTAKAISKMSTEEKVYCIKKLMLERRDGSDIFTLLNLRHHDLDEIKNHLSKTEDQKTDDTFRINKKNYTVFNVTKNVNHAIIDLEWLYNKEENYDKGVYQIALVFVDPSSNTQRKINILVKDNILLGDETNSLRNAYPKDTPLNNDNILFYEEDAESFKAKINYVKNPKPVNGVETIVVDNQDQAILQAQQLLLNNNIQLIMGYNSFGKGISDWGFLNPNGELDSLKTLDIRTQALQKIYTQKTAMLDGEKIDDIRKPEVGILKPQQEGVAHDSLTDCLDELELFNYLINNAQRTSSWYTSDIDKLIGYFTDNDIEAYDLRKAISNQELTVSQDLEDIYESSGLNTNNKFKRGNQVIKEIFDDFNLAQFNHNFRRTNIRALNATLDNYLDVYSEVFNEAYTKSIENPKQRKIVSDILLSIINYTSGKDIYDIIRRNEYTPEDLVAINNALSGPAGALQLLNKAITVYKRSLRNSINPELALISNKNASKLFFTRSENEIVKDIARAKWELDNKNLLDNGTYNYNDYYKYETAAVKNIYTLMKNSSNLDLNNFFESFRNSQAINYTDLIHNETANNLINQLIMPLQRMFGLSNDTDTSTAFNDIKVDSILKDHLSPETRTLLLNSLLNVYGTTEVNKNNLQLAKESTTYNGRRKRILNITSNDTYKKQMEDMLFTKDGLFNKQLVQLTSLWSMGTGARQFTKDGEDNVLTIGYDRLTSTKAFKELYGEYTPGKDFYVIVWRQPGQQTTPLQVMKVKVVDGYEYSMTATTARNLHNGDFDGDYFYTTAPLDIAQEFGNSLFKYQNIAGGFISKIFENKNPIALNNNKAVYAEAAKRTFTDNSVKKALSAVLSLNSTNDIDLKNTDEYKHFIDTFVKVYVDTTTNANVGQALNKNARAIEAENILDSINLQVIKLTNGYTITANIPYFDSKDPIADLLRMRNKAFLSDNNLNTLLEAVEVGNMAKKLHSNKRTVPSNELSKLFYNTSYSMDKDTINELQELINNTLLNSNLTNSKNPNIVNRASMIKYVDDLYASNDLSKEYRDLLCNDDGMIAKAKSAKDFLIIAQILQEGVQESDNYNNAILNVLPKMLDTSNKELYDKYKILYDYMKQEYPKSITTKLDNNADGLALLQAITNFMHYHLSDRQRKNYITFSQSDDPTAFKIYSDLLFRQKELNFSDVRDDQRIITTNELVNLNPASDLSNNRGNVVGLADAYIAVPRISNTLSNATNDTMAIVNNNSMSSRINLQRIKQYDLNDLSSSKKQLLINFLSKSSNMLVKGHALNQIFGLELDDTIKYQVIGIVDRINNVVDINDIKQTKDLTNYTLLLSTSSSLYDELSRRNIKLGVADAKAGKGSAVQYKGPSFTTQVDIVMSDKLFDITRLGRDFEESVCYDENGDAYTLYHVKNLALLNQLNWSGEDVAKDRFIDTITIVQGSHGLGSIVKFGNLFLHQEDNGDWTYDPSYFNELNKAMSYDSIEQSLQETNSAHTIRLIRILYSLAAIKDKTKLTSLIKTISTQTGLDECTTIDDLAKKLFTVNDLGGFTGANIEQYILHNMTDQEKQSRQNSYRTKNNPFGSVVFSKEVDNLMLKPYGSYSNYTGEDDQVIAHKKAKPTDSSVRVSKYRPESDNEQVLAAYEHSGVDLNDGYFIGTDTLLNLLMTQLNRRYVSSTTKRAYTEEVLTPITGRLGNLYNGYNFISDNQMLNVDGANLEEVISAKKAGNKWSYSAYNRNQEEANLIPLLYKSKHIGKTDSINDYTSISGNNNATVLRSMLPYFSQGRKQDIVEGNNLFDFGYDTTMHKKALTLNTQGNDAVFKVKTYQPDYVNTTEDKLKLASYDEMLKRIEENSRNPREQLILAQKKELFHNDLANIPIADAERVLNELLKTKQTYIEEFNNIIEDYNASEDYINYESITPKFNLDALYNSYKTDPSNVLNVARCYADDNGIKLINSILNSYGYRAKNNGEIALGSQTINFQNNVGHYKDTLLNRDYEFIIRASKVLPEAYQLLNKYMELQAIIEAYDELHKSKDGKTFDYKKIYGENKFNEYLEALEKAMGNYTINDLKEIQNNIYKENSALSTMIAAASRINKRLVMEISKQDPTGLIGWVLTSDSMSEPQKKSFLKYKNVSLAKLYKTNFVESISAIGKQIESMNTNDLGTLFFNNKAGYIGMIEDLSTRIAVTKASDDLGDYMRRTGWMNNLTTKVKALEIFDSIVDKFIEETNDPSYTEDEKTYNINKYYYDTYSYMYSEATGEVLEKYVNKGSILKLYSLVSNTYENILSSLEVKGLQEARDKLYQLSCNSDGAEKQSYDASLKVLNAYENIFAGTIKLIEYSNKGTTLYKEINKALTEYAHANNKVLVDSHGRHLNSADKTQDYSRNHFYIDLLNILSPKPNNKDDLDLYTAKEALLGNVYLMDTSVAEQLEKKVYTKRVHSVLKSITKKAKNITTSLIMSSPIALLDRLVNFPLFDTGIVGSADGASMKYIPEAIATINKYIYSKDSLSDESVISDPKLKHLLRFLVATNQNLFNTETIRGEKVKLDIPLLRKYTSLANLGYNLGNLVPRFAYYLNLVNDAEANNYTLNPNKLGVVWDKSEQIDKIEASTFIKNSDLYTNNDEANLDAKIAYVISQHNGLEGNMPYGANWLNENFNTMFLTFPMALVRWGKNRLTSLGNAFADIANGNQNGGLKYLAGQLGSVVLSQTILLIMQMLLSENTRKYLFSDEELTEEEKEDAANILFRGGVVKPFQSLLQGDEVTTTALNRGPVSALTDSYLGEFIDDPDDSFWKNAKDTLLQHTWGHANFLQKDMIESIPGNKVLQSNSWYVPSSNFFDNYGRKVLGYSLGSTQANNFVDYMQTKHSDDTNSINKLGKAMTYAYSNKYSNMKENKSEIKNYKKAMQLVYNWYTTVYGNTSSSNNIANNNSNDLSSALKKTITTGGSSYDVYSIIEDYLRNGGKYSEVQKALRKVSLREHLLTMSDYQGFINSLSDSEYTVIQTALQYEDHAYPYLDDILEEINRQATREYYNENNYKSSLKSILRTMDYNTPEYYSYNSHRKSLNTSTRFFNDYNKSMKNYNNPMSAYAQAQKNINYGLSTDVFGNQKQYYTNGTSYDVRNRGSNIIPGGE